MVSTSQHHEALDLALAGKIPEAEAIFRKLLDDDPADAEALHFFGVLATQKNNIADAELNFRRALETRPDWGKAWHSLGAALFQQGRLQEAVEAIGKAVRLDPDTPAWRLTHGVALRALGRLPEAADTLRAFTVAEPQSAEAFGILGEVLREMSLYSESEAACRRALAIDPRLAEAHNNLGNALRGLRRGEEAEAAYRTAIEIKPKTGRFHGNLANVLRSRGEFAEAKAEYRQCVELEPTHTEAYRMLADLGDLSAEDPIFERMGKMIQSSATPGGPKIDLHFATAKVLEDNGDYDGAFEHWRSGNQLKDAAIRWDDAAREEYAARVIATFDKDLLERYPADESTTAGPIFILGMPRTGTTLVEQILVSHSEVDAGGELPVLGRLARENEYPEKCGELTPEQIKDLRERYMTDARPGDRARFTDKMPGNYIRIGLIRILFPDARIVHCRRDPVDTCLSCYRTNFRGGAQGFAYNLKNLGLEYRRYQRIMDHWSALLPGAIHEVRYEDLIAQQETEIRRLLEFCGLDFEEACLRFHETDRTVETASAGQVRQEIYGTAVERWKKYENHIQPLLDVLEIR